MLDLYHLRAVIPSFLSNHQFNAPRDVSFWSFISATEGTLLSWKSCHVLKHRNSAALKCWIYDTYVFVSSVLFSQNKCTMAVQTGLTVSWPKGSDLFHLRFVLISPLNWNRDQDFSCFQMESLVEPVSTFALFSSLGFPLTSLIQSTDQSFFPKNFLNKQARQVHCGSIIRFNLVRSELSFNTIKANFPLKCLSFEWI